MPKMCSIFNYPITKLPIPNLAKSETNPEGDGEVEWRDPDNLVTCCRIREFSPDLFRDRLEASLPRRQPSCRPAARKPCRTSVSRRLCTKKKRHPAKRAEATRKQRSRAEKTPPEKKLLTPQARAQLLPASRGSPARAVFASRAKSPFLACWDAMQRSAQKKPADKSSNRRPIFELLTLPLCPLENRQRANTITPH